MDNHKLNCERREACLLVDHKPTCREKIIQSEDKYKNSNNNALRATSRKIILKAPTFQYKYKAHLIRAMPYPANDLIAQLGCLSLHKPSISRNSSLCCKQKNIKALTVKADSVNSVKHLKACSDNFTSLECANNRDTVWFSHIPSESCSFASLPASKLKNMPTSCTNGQNTSRIMSRLRLDDTEVYRSKGNTSTSSVPVKGMDDHSHTKGNIAQSCAYQARFSETDILANELASYMENYLVLPKKMSTMAEMMYT